MYNIRLHGRGGQGIKTAGRILGSALFLQGWQVQDAPRYGAERRGAPMSATVRAGREPIHQRGAIRRPDLIAVADDSLLAMPAAGVLAGIQPAAILLLLSNEPAGEWQRRLNLAQTPITLPRPADLPVPEGMILAGAAARLLGVVEQETLQQAIAEELAKVAADARQASQETALAAFAALSSQAGCVRESTRPDPISYTKPDWIELPLDPPGLAAPVIEGGPTSELVKTGLWRTQRPVIDYAHCHHCWWVCSSFCPDSAIHVDAQGRPAIDYEHCKGCMICVAQCPSHAIAVQPEVPAKEDVP